MLLVNGVEGPFLTHVTVTQGCLSCAQLNVDQLFTRIKTDVEEKVCLQGSVTFIYNCSLWVLHAHFASLGFRKVAQSFPSGSFP